MGVIGQTGLGTQTGEWTDARLGADLGALDDRVGEDLGPWANDTVLEETIGADPHTRGQAHLALDDDIDIDLDIGLGLETAAQIEARRIGQGDA